MTEERFRLLLAALEDVWRRESYRFDDGGPIPPNILARYLADKLEGDDE